MISARTGLDGIPNIEHQRRASEGVQMQDLRDSPERLEVSCIPP